MKKAKKDEAQTEYEQKVGELTSALQRSQADFANFRRQSEADSTRIRKNTKIDFLLEILPVLDNFQLAAKHAPAELENDVWAQGIKQIEKQFEMILEREGLEKIPAVGEQFDHNFHEAIEYIVSDKPENEIVEEVLSGYKFSDNVLRASKVKVSRGK